MVLFCALCVLHSCDRVSARSKTKISLPLGIQLKCREVCLHVGCILIQVMHIVEIRMKERSIQREIPRRSWDVTAFFHAWSLHLYSQPLMVFVIRGH